MQPWFKTKQRQTCYSICFSSSLYCCTLFPNKQFSQHEFRAHCMVNLLIRTTATAWSFPLLNPNSLKLGVSLFILSVSLLFFFKYVCMWVRWVRVSIAGRLDYVTIRAWFTLGMHGVDMKTDIIRVLRVIGNLILFSHCWLDGPCLCVLKVGL